MKNENIYNAISNISPEYLEELSFEKETAPAEIKPAKHTKFPIIAIICAVVGLAGVTSVAAIRGILGRGMNQLQIDESQQQELVEQSAAIVYTSESVTDTSETSENTVLDVDAITVTPVSVVADERCAFISFKVSGFTFDDRNNEPFFDRVFAYEDEAMTIDLDCEGGFYNGINLIGSDFFYEDGTPAQFDERGMMILHYFDKDGNLYYLMKVSGRNIDKNMLGRTVYIRLVNLCEIYKCDIVNGTDREWSFTLDMPTESTSVHYDIDTLVDGTSFNLDSIELSPISVRLNYTLGEGASPDSMPKFAGVVLKDGTVLGIGDDVHNASEGGKAYSNCYFVRAIDPEDVESIIIIPDMDNPSESVTIQI